MSAIFTASIASAEFSYSRKVYLENKNILVLLLYLCQHKLSNQQKMLMQTLANSQHFMLTSHILPITYNSMFNASVPFFEYIK